MTSRTLAHIILKGIEGTVYQEPRVRQLNVPPHDVYFKIHDSQAHEEENKVNEIKWNMDRAIDNFVDVTVDLSDIRRILFKPKDWEVPGIPLRNEIIQAAVFGHFISERFSYYGYNNDGGNPGSGTMVFGQAHGFGLEFEYAIINDMVSTIKAVDVKQKLIPFRDKKDNNSVRQFKPEVDKSIFPYYIFYPLHDPYDNSKGAIKCIYFIRVDKILEKDEIKPLFFYIDYAWLSLDKNCDIPSDFKPES